MIYTFEDVDTGEVLALEMPMGEAVAWGKVIRRGGKKLKRLPDTGAGVLVDHGSMSVQVPKNHPDAPRVDSKGFPQFNNKRERDEFIKKHNGRNLHQVLDVD